MLLDDLILILGIEPFVPTTPRTRVFIEVARAFSCYLDLFVGLRSGRPTIPFYKSFREQVSQSQYGRSRQRSTSSSRFTCEQHDGVHFRWERL